MKIAWVGILLSSHSSMQFAAEVLRRQHVEGRKWLIHEQDLRLHNQRARKPNPLLHAARELFRIGRLEAVEPDSIQRVKAAGRRSASATPRALSGASTFSCTVSHGNRAKL